MWKIISAIAFVLAIGVGTRWVMDGAQIFTKNKQQIVIVDDLFGTESVTWEEGFWLGLDRAGPASVILIAVGILGLCKSRRNRRLY